MCFAPSDSTADTTATAPNSHSLRSRRQTAVPATTTTTAPIPKYWEERTGPWLPPTTRLMADPKKPVESAGAGRTKSRTTVPP